jgi:type IV fimbrial biogenesis protein FimT
MNTPVSQRQQRGLTLVESMVAVALTSIVAGIAAPSFERLKERQMVQSIASQIETDIVHVRSQAAAMNRSLRLHFASNRCYVVHDGGPTTCICGDDGSASCTSGARVLQVQRWSEQAPVTVQSNSASIGFDAFKGTVTPTATVKVIGASGTRLHNVINIMGRVRSCVPAAGATSC